MVKCVARSFGAVASFMPKPYSNDFRSGAHHNMSLADSRAGENLFDPARRPIGEKARRYGLQTTDDCIHFVGGLLEHADALCALTCPSYNSYKGLIAQGDMPDMSWAPVLKAYGRNNRSAMVRLPMNRPCIENRTPDMSANFYLSTALSLHAGLDGLAKENINSAMSRIPSLSRRRGMMTYLSSIHPHCCRRSRMCAGTGAVTVTGGLFLKIGTVTSRECRCSGGPPVRGAAP